MAGLMEEMEDLKVRRIGPEAVLRFLLAELGMLLEKHVKTRGLSRRVPQSHNAPSQQRLPQVVQI